MTDKDRLAVAVVEARIAGVHPDWVKWAMGAGSTAEQAIRRLEYMTRASSKGDAYKQSNPVLRSWMW